MGLSSRKQPFDLGLGGTSGEEMDAGTSADGIFSRRTPASQGDGNELQLRLIRLLLKG